MAKFPYIRMIMLIACGLLIFPHTSPVFAAYPPINLHTTPEYEPVQADNKVIIPFDFAKASIKGAHMPDIPSGTKILSVDIVFTLYPVDTAEWSCGFTSLLHQRIDKIRKLYPEAANAQSWNGWMQTAGKTLPDANSLFHGFVITTEPIPIDQEKLPPPTEAQPVQSPESIVHEKFPLVEKWVSGNLSFRDSTVFRVFERMDEPEDALVVIDWTASMYGNGSQLIRWQELNRKWVKHIVFFNDGDTLHDTLKIPGATGGIYHSGPALEEVLQVMHTVMLNGEGSDYEENDMEAVLDGLEACKDCKRIILIADNTAPVRDLELAGMIGRPVDVILCSVWKQKIHPDYLNLAKMTGGKLWLMDEELGDFEGYKEGMEFTHGAHTYRVERGLFILVDE